MIIPVDKIEIPDEKILEYLLVEKEKNDKSAFLKKIGYSIENWKELVNDIKNIAATNNASLQQSTKFGDVYEVHGKLKNFGIVTIWLLAVNNDKYRFITLYPD